MANRSLKKGNVQKGKISPFVGIFVFVTMIFIFSWVISENKKAASSPIPAESEEDSLIKMRIDSLHRAKEKTPD